MIVRAIFAGLAVLIAGGWPWPLLAAWNLRVVPTVPWAVVPMAVYMWLFWKYVGGTGWPHTTAETRRGNLRANRVAADVWPLAIVSGLIGLAALVPLLGIMSRLACRRTHSRSRRQRTCRSSPMFLMLVMASIVAGVVEEAAFRGYMQTPIERRHGVVVAILVNGTMFGLTHVSHHPADVLWMLPLLHRRRRGVWRADVGDQLDPAGSRDPRRR